MHAFASLVIGIIGFICINLLFVLIFSSETTGIIFTSLVMGIYLYLPEIGKITRNKCDEYNKWKSINNYAKFLDVLSNDELTYILKSSIKDKSIFMIYFQAYQIASLTVNISRGLQTLGYDFGNGIYLEYSGEPFAGFDINVYKIDNNECIATVLVIAKKDEIAIFNNFSLIYYENDSSCPRFLLKTLTVGEETLAKI